ncbi:MAG TPA: AAA family ATPase [Candidatus Solibacter sp.]|nr:AAA family ATPase [Candidatus Solibacter sp.]
MESRAAKTLAEIFQSGRPLTYVRTAEEQRVGRILRDVAKILHPTAPMPVWSWSVTEEMHRDGEAPAAGTESPREALDFIVAHPGAGIFHLKDFHEPLRESAQTRRRLRDIYAHCAGQNKFVVISSPVREIPEEIERSVMFLELRPPDVVELTAFLREECPGVDGEMLQSMAGALLGLTTEEARYALRRALAVKPELAPESIPVLLEEKRMLVSRTGVIEFIADPTTIGDVGGIEVLKNWLLERRKLFQMRDSISSEIVPKGLLMMGIPGCGKSLCVKAIASTFQLPLYRIDMIEIFSGRHGKPEGAFVEACKLVEDLSPAVLWFDEIEMGITSTETAGEQGRIFAFFLTWMQEKTRGLFVAATANRIDLLPAEMIRKGRFDEVFFVDLPNDDERIDIFRIHLVRRGLDPAKFQLDQLTEFTTGWTGAEIEQCVVSAITRTRLEDRELTNTDLVRIAAKIVPLSRTMHEQINHIRAWAFERAVKASKSR